MKIVEWPGLHYCQDCDALIVNEDYDSIEFCDKCAKKRGWNFINRRRVKVPKDEDKKHGTTTEGNSPTEAGESGPQEGSSPA